MNDMNLLAQWRAGDLKAGDTLLRRHYAYAFRLARRRLGRDDLAAEATQQAMAVVVQKRNEITTDFRSYLGKVVHFCALSQTKRRPHEPLDDGSPPASPHRGASTLLIRREDEKTLVTALRALSADDQMIFYCDYVGHKDRTDLARRLKLPKQCIYRRVHTAKQRLRRQLEIVEDSPGRRPNLGGLQTWLTSIHKKIPGMPAGSC